MLPSSTIHAKPTTNSQFLNPAPHHLRTFVLDYLCHNCYPSAARAFANESTVRHIDADGDEIMQIEEHDGDAVQLVKTLQLVELRENIRVHILSGRVEDAIGLLNEHFPSVLSMLDDPFAEPLSLNTQTSGEVVYVAPTSVDPAHLVLNLRILAFIEASRTIPLVYSPSAGRANSQHKLHQEEPLFEKDDPDTDEKQADLLSKAQKLYALANMLPKPEDRATYFAELGNVGALLAYKVPEQSAMSKYLSQERREAVADQINSAILYKTGLPAVSHLELCARYTATIWNALHEFRTKAPPPSSWPPGVRLPSYDKITSDMPASKAHPNVDRELQESVPPFDLQLFLNMKS